MSHHTPPCPRPLSASKRDVEGAPPAGACTSLARMLAAGLSQPEADPHWERFWATLPQAHRRDASAPITLAALDRQVDSIEALLWAARSMPEQAGLWRAFAAHVEVAIADDADLFIKHTSMAEAQRFAAGGSSLADLRSARACALRSAADENEAGDIDPAWGNPRLAAHLAAIACLDDPIEAARQMVEMLMRDCGHRRAELDRWLRCSLLALDANVEPPGTGIVDFAAIESAVAARSSGVTMACPYHQR